MTEQLTLEQFDKLFPDDKSARDYICKLRWGQFARCPYCNNEKSYFIEKGKRYKCANKGCYKKYSVTVGTLMEASNIDLHIWMKGVFLYCKARGKLLEKQFADDLGLSPKSIFFMVDKLDFVYPLITRDIGQPIMKTINSVIMGLISQAPLFNEKRDSLYSFSPFHIKEDEINDISNPVQYNKIIRYTRYFIKVYADWMWLDFAEPEDVVSEMFINIKDEGVKEYNWNYLRKKINKTAQDMWLSFLKKHPKYNDANRKKNVRDSQKRIQYLKKAYIVTLILNSKNNTLSRKEINNSPKLIEETRNRIKLKRDSGKGTNFISHFS